MFCFFFVPTMFKLHLHRTLELYTINEFISCKQSTRVGLFTYFPNIIRFSRFRIYTMCARDPGLFKDYPWLPTVQKAGESGDFMLGAFELTTSKPWG
jgi:hypothetical protein